MTRDKEKGKKVKGKRQNNTHCSHDTTYAIRTTQSKMSDGLKHSKVCNGYRSQSFEDFRNLCCRTNPIAVGAIIKVGKNHLRENTRSSTLVAVLS